MPANAPSIRVVIRLPRNRPENAEPDPPPIEWTAEKADILWKVIEKSRSSDSGGTDWKGLAAHLEVPLPYLLYRVNARFQEEIRGLKDIQGALSPSAAATSTPIVETQQAERPPLTIRTGVQHASSSKILSPSRINTPRNVRARLTSLGINSPRPKKATSSSTLTVQGARRNYVAMPPHSPSSSEEGDSDEELALKEEEAERAAEEQEALGHKLKELNRLITNDAVGLIPGHGLKKSVDRGRTGLSSPVSAAGSYRNDSLSSRSDNQSLSSAGSPQGSIPEIPSPRTDSQSHSPLDRHRSPTESPSPAAVSPRSTLGHSHRRYNQLVGEHGSGHASETSSFSDLSDTSLSASALESALMSNIRSGNTTRRSTQFPSRSRNTQRQP